MVLKRMLVFVVLACVVMAWIPVSASAVDPVSAATMANALAQAVTAYGASQGVSMTFDVTNTDGIGEGVKDLWDNFKDDVSDNDVPTYDSLAVTVWSTLFLKVGDKLAINLDAESVSYLDKFWNWLLSGPAEMEKVDNQYYQWTVDQSGNVDPIIVNDSSIYYIDGNKVQFVRTSFSWVSGNGYTWTLTVPNPSYAYLYDYGTGYMVGILSQYPGSTVYMQNGVQYSAGMESISYDWYAASIGSFGYTSVNLPPFERYSSKIVPSSVPSNSISTDVEQVSVVPYVGDAVPQDVYIPDNDDVNYVPIPAQIPLDVNWDDTLFGDGSGTLSDAQSEAATSALDNAITDNPAKTLELADTTDPPAPAPGEVYIPFLPVTLPSFNFNFSGIWHYVVDWISSLGAWFSMVLTVWSNLPYAMTVPVYACLVILIVLGVYRRFLS